MELAVIASETHEKAVAYFRVAEQYGYKFIMEVKEIRDKQYYKAIGYSSFEDYCETSWKSKRDFMDERITIAEQLGNVWETDGTYRQLGHSKSLILARMEPERRQEVMSQPQQLPSGDVKTVNELTVREMKRLERERDEAEARAKREEQEKNHWQGVAKSQQNMPPRVVTQTVDVVPDTLKKKLGDLEYENTNLKHGYKEAKEKLQQYELRDTDGYDAEQAQRELEKLQRDADTNTVQLRLAFKQFVEKAAITQFLQAAITYSTPSEKERLSELVEAAEKIIDQTKLALRGRKLGVVNE